jgi:hypothetical protein
MIVNEERHRHHNEHASMSCCIPRYQAYNETTFLEHMPTEHGQWTKVQEGIGYVFEKKLDCPKKDMKVLFLTHTCCVRQYILVSLFTLDPTCFGYFNHQRSVHYIFSYYFL